MERLKTGGADRGEVQAPLDDDGRHDPAWVKELCRRIDEIESGTAVTLSEEELFSRLRERPAARCVPDQDPSQSSD